MSKVDSLKKLNKRMTGKEVNGETVCEVIICFKKHLKR